jgi:multimeric flavodoxin WrbA
MKRILVVWHSRTGAARQMAAAAARGAESEPGTEVRLLAADAAQAADLLAADGYIFAAPENLAALSGAMKEFFDRNYYAVLDQLNGRPYGLLIAAGSDGQNAVRQAQRIATGWRLKAIAEPIVVGTHAQTPQAITAEKVVRASDLAACEGTGRGPGRGPVDRDVLIAHHPSGR